MTFQGEHSFDEQLNLYNSRSTITYLANINDTNSSISCYVQQSDVFGNLLYYSQESIIILVEPLPPSPQPVSLTAEIGMISGVLITGIFLLLTCVLVTAVMCRRQKQARSSSCDSSVHQSDYRKPVWTTMQSARPDFSGSTLSTQTVHRDILASQEISESVVDIGAHASDISYNRNNTSAENQRKLPNPVRNIHSGRPGPFYETHFGDNQRELPVTYLHSPGLFLRPPNMSESRTRSISCIEPSNRKVSSTFSEGYPCWSSSH